MATTESESKNIHFAITYVKSTQLPDIIKTKKFSTTPRRLYVRLSVDGVSDEIDLEASINHPVKFLCKPPFILTVELFAERTSHDNDLFVAHAKEQLDSTSNDTELSVFLTPFAEFGLKERPVLLFKITASDRFNGSTGLESMKASLEVNPRLAKAFGYVKHLIKVGTALSELNPIAKAVMRLVELASSEFETFINRDESLLRLVEEVNHASVFISDWDDPALVTDRPNQQRVFVDLLLEIYHCLHLLWTLSGAKLKDRLSDESVNVVNARRDQLAALLKRMESNQLLDTQATVFKVSSQVSDLHNDSTINRLHAAKDVGPSTSKACLPDTRVSLLSRINDWALSPTSARVLLLHGAAGKGKSSIVHSAVKALQSSNVAMVPFFAFNRSDLDRSASQLIPTWAKHLAQVNPRYLAYLHKLSLEQVESSDILDQLDPLLIGCLGNGIDNGKPLIFVVDALDECPARQSKKLLDILQKLLLRNDLPCFIRFLFTYRSDESIQTTFNNLPRHVALSIPIDDAEGTKEDIHKFIMDQLKGTNVIDMVDVVAEAAQTLFECAAVVCRELTGKRLRSSLVKAKLVEWLKISPGISLYDSYLTILKAYIDEDDTDLMVQFRRIMAWVLFVQSPQSRRTFRTFAIAFSTDEDPLEDQILSDLGSLFSGTMLEGDKPISPLHTSFRDFLLDCNASGNYSINPSLHSHEAELASACLKVMNTSLNFNICDLPTSFALNSEIPDLCQRVEQYISPALHYACLATAYHLRSSVIPSSSDQQTNTTSVTTAKNLSAVEECKLFLKQKFLYWLEAHSCMQTERPEDAPGTTLPIFLTWALAVGDTYLQDVLLDFIKFEKRFREGIRLSAPQIYYSGLAFAPRDSVVSHLYYSLFHHLIEVSEGGDIIWPQSEPLVIEGMSAIHSIAFSLDGTCIASAGSDRTIRVWDAITGQQVGKALIGHKSGVTSVAFSPLDDMHIVSGSNDKTIRLWDMSTRQEIGEPLRGHEAQIRSIAFSPDGTRIASGSDDNTVRIWDTAKMQQVGEALKGHKDGIMSIAFAPDGTCIASGSKDETIRLWHWDALTGQQVGQALGGHTSWVVSVVFSHDGKYILSGSWDGTIRWWDTATGQEVGDTLEGEFGGIDSIALSRDGTHLAASGNNGRSIKVWNMKTRQQVGKLLKGHKDLCFSVVFSPLDCMCIASGAYDKTIKVWDIDMTPIGQQKLETGNSESPINQNIFNGLYSISFLPDSMHIALGNNSTIEVWNIETGQQIGKALNLDLLVDEITAVAFSLDGTHFASGSKSCEVRVWDTATGRQVSQALLGPSSWVNSIAFSPIGTRIALGSGGTIRVWDTAMGQQLEFSKGHEDLVRSIAFSPDGMHMASGSYDRTVRVWDTATGQQVGKALTGHTNVVTSVAFSLTRDGKSMIASGSRDTTIRLWDMSTGQQVGQALEGHKSWVTSVAFSPDGTHIASASDDRTIRVWDTVTGKEVDEAVVRQHEDEVNSVVFSPDGLHIASESRDETIRVWDVETVQSNKASNIRLHDSNTGFYLGHDTLILWVPHALRHMNFQWYPCTKVISPKRVVALRFDEASESWGPNWANIKK